MLTVILRRINNSVQPSALICQIHKLFDEAKNITWQHWRRTKIMISYYRETLKIDIAVFDGKMI